jgi:hypothetical protein
MQLSTAANTPGLTQQSFRHGDGSEAIWSRHGMSRSNGIGVERLVGTTFSEAAGRISGTGHLQRRSGAPACDDVSWGRGEPECNRLRLGAPDMR